jgi:hypothetical protein
VDVQHATNGHQASLQADEIRLPQRISRPHVLADSDDRHASEFIVPDTAARRQHRRADGRAAGSAKSVRGSSWPGTAGMM